jgi:hypothetical protein
VTLERPVTPSTEARELHPLINEAKGNSAAKAGRVHQVEYTPTGQVEDGFWGTIEPSSWIYGRMSRDLKPNLACGFWVK